MRQVNHLVLLIIFGLLLLGPGGAAAALSPQDLQRSESLYQSGQYEDALALLEPLAQQPIVSTEDSAGYLLMARILIAQNRTREALTVLEHIPEAYRTARINLLLGKTLAENNQSLAAIGTLQPLLGEPLDLNDQEMLYQALVKATRESQQPLLTLYYLQQLLPVSANRAAILQQAHRLLQNNMSEGDLQEAAFMWQGTAIGQDALLQLAQRAQGRQQYAKAKDYAAEIFVQATPFPYWYEATRILTATPAPADGQNKSTVGVMLPLSGRYAVYGDQIRNGLELALADYNLSHPEAITFVYQDTASGEDMAALVDHLAVDKQVIGIIGPLLKNNAIEAARQAQLLMLPLLSLAQAEGIPQIGSYIFRDTLTARQQAETLVDFAMRQGQTRFSILHPDNLLGTTLSELFTNAVMEAGGSIVDIVSYPEESTDFKEQTYALVHMTAQRLAAFEKKAVSEKKYPTPPFDALFIPDYADKIQLLAPQLVFYGLKDTTLLGINGWNSPELAERTDRYLSDAVFVDGFFAGSTQPEVERFIDLYRQSYKGSPNILVAQAFDVASEMLQSLADPQVISRDDLRRKLLELRNFKGVTGTTGFDAEGETIKQLYLLRFERGRIVEY